MNTILYLHGFLSTPASVKATQLGDYLRTNASPLRYLVPSLHHDPDRAVQQAAKAVESAKPESLTLVGSSLGGFYATVLAERIGCRAVLLNPAVHPQRLFRRFVGPQTNPYTGEVFELTGQHVAALAALDPPAITQPSRYWLVVETGDEVLDHRDALARYAGARQEVIAGGDHTLRSFPAHLPGIVRWASAPLAPAAAP